VGFLVAGVIIGPYGIGMVKDVHSVEMFAEIGVILLLFTIGIEFSMAKTSQNKKGCSGRRWTAGFTYHRFIRYCCLSCNTRH
jgi:CPA2 family monovalent cation:H+ antiporter-2